jgi:hypothetical protein
MKYVVVLRLNAAEKFLRSLITDSFLFSAPTESFCLDPAANLFHSSIRASLVMALSTNP